MSSVDTPKNQSEISYRPIAEDYTVSYHLIYFITGNPGLIAYYNTFLGTLHELLSTSKSKSPSQFHIYGRSLAGFEDNDHKRSEPYNLEEQIVLSLESLKDQKIPTGPRQGQPYSSVILIGHSVGSYILLEIIQRLRKSSSPINIQAGILLFPTITHIAQSPSGVKISTLFRIPNFVRGATAVANALIAVTPTSVLKRLVPWVTRMPEDAAEVTTRFLTSKMGIWQAL